MCIYYHIFSSSIATYFTERTVRLASTCGNYMYWGGYTALDC